MAQPIPNGHHTITPYLVVKGASEAIEFYKRAFGAEELSRLPFTGKDGQVKLAHADLKIGDSRLFLTDEFPEHGATGPDGHSPVTLHLFVPDADTFYIYGQIAKPGTYPVLRNMTLRQAVALSGGVTAAGSERKITLHRPGSKDTEATLDQLIERNDVLIVKERLF